MTQAPICQLLADVAAIKWQGHRGLFGRNERWTHPCLPGVTVRHCGHPTALWPYYVTVDGAEAPPLADEQLRGRTFKQLRDAQESVMRALMAVKTTASINQAAAESLAARLPSMGYLKARVLPDGSVAALQQLMFTRAICLGCHEEGWARRFCFHDFPLADTRFAELQSEDDEPAGSIAQRLA